MMGKLGQSATRESLWLVTVLVGAALGTGCAPADYRVRADRETYGILAEKAPLVPAVIPPPVIQPPPASRLFDPYSPDKPPMPPDDPAAHQYMHCVDGKRGYHGWEKNGVAPTIESPTWLDCLELDSQGRLQLNPDRAFELGLLNSREYQFQLEELYFSALALTFERFEFDLQWFFSNTTFYEHFGSGGSADNESNTLVTSSNLGFTRAFATGGQLLVDFANMFVWEFTGPDMSSTTSNLAIQLTQPLLRGAFRDVRLEALTQAERNVLYALREFVRFRKQFYVDVTAGQQGYLSLLLQLQAIRNLESNLESLEQNLAAHEALAEAGFVSQLQVDQVLQSYQQGRLDLIQTQNNFDNSLDNYKVLLGLPPELHIELDDSQLAPFELSAPEINQLEGEVQELVAYFRNLDEAPPLARLESGFEELRAHHERALEQLAQVEEELERWQSQEAGRSESEENDTEIEQEQRERELEARRQLAQRLAETRTDMQNASGEIAAAAAAVEEATRAQAWQAILRLARQEMVVIGDLFVLQTQIRTYLVELEPVEYETEEAITIALTNRLDLANRRAEVVDEWRRIRVAADALEADLDVFVEADIATEPGGDNPLAFSSEASRYRVGARFDAPLNRLAERNLYRGQLIEYQRARRRFMAARDDVVRAVRRDLRQLRADRLAFEIARQQLIVAARRVELAQLQLLARGLEGNEDPSDSSATVDVLNALDSLLNAKNSLIGAWVAYETGRLRLSLDMEQLQVEEARGDRDVLLPSALEPESIPPGVPLPLDDAGH